MTHAHFPPYTRHREDMPAPSKSVHPTVFDHRVDCIREGCKVRPMASYAAIQAHHDIYHGGEVPDKLEPDYASLAKTKAAGPRSTEPSSRWREFIDEPSVSEASQDELEPIEPTGQAINEVMEPMIKDVLDALYPDGPIDTLDGEQKLRIEQEAHGLVYGARQATYGHPDADFKAMGRIMGAILQRHYDSQGIQLITTMNSDETVEIDVPDIPANIVALIMVAVKISRESAQHKRDNLVDIIGYALCKDRIEDGT